MSIVKKKFYSQKFAQVKSHVVNLFTDWQLWLLVSYALILRIIYVYKGVIPFTFDHGKDLLAIAHMVLTATPKLIGPWTSIPGLFFGPAWYYLLAPFYWIFNFNPVAAVIPLIFLLLIQIVLVKRSFGLTTALLVACVPAWFTISVSAWNPFPMTFISWLILLLFARVEKSKSITVSSALLIGMIMSFGFHFSAAFAIFYPFIFISLILFRRWKISVKSAAAWIVGFALPFLPQLLFEIRHEFVELHAVVSYLTQLGSQSGRVSILEVLWRIINEVKLAISPDLISPVITSTFFVVLLGASCYVVLAKYRSDVKLRYYLIQALLFTVIPLIGLSFLHYNNWYVLGLLPPWTLLVGYCLSQMPRKLSVILIGIILASPLLLLHQYITTTQHALEMSRQFLPIKLRAIDLIYEKSNGQPFSSYHYVPDVYDYSYQSLYIINGLLGKELPVEFSYQQQVPEYYQGKNEILSAIERKTGKIQAGQSPKSIFFIVEKPERQNYLDEWWSRQKYGKIEDEYVLSPELVVYKATMEK